MRQVCKPDGVRAAVLALLAGLAASGCAPATPIMPYAPPTVGLDASAPATTATENRSGPDLATLVGQAAEAPPAERLVPNDSSTELERSGSLPPGALARFVLPGRQGQTVAIVVSSLEDAVVPGLAGDDGVDLKYPSDVRPTWRGPLPATQDYHLTLLNTADDTRAYRLRLELASDRLATGAPPADGPATPATPTAAPEAAALFAFGAQTQTLSLAITGQADPARSLAFEAAAGQVLVAAARAADGTTLGLAVEGPTGTSLPGPRRGSWRGPLPWDGTYLLQVSGTATTATVAARLARPRLLAGDGHALSGPPPWRLTEEIVLQPGELGGGRWSLGAGLADQLEIVLTEAPTDASALVAVWSETGGGLQLFDPAVPGTTLRATVAGDETVVLFLWSGGARGRTVRYSARLTAR